MGRRKINKKEKIIRYILKNRDASVKQIAEATGSSTKYVYNLKSQSGTPKEVIQKELNVQPVVTETFKDYSGNEYHTYALKNKPTKDRVRTTILQEAESLVSGDREEEHGDFYSNACLTAKLWKGYTGWDIQPEQVPVMLALLKVARSNNSKNMDNFRDAAGYLALAAELNS